ncbi:DUF922 domain-containing protein [Vibrio atlanticus]|nr:DUF922 domain-containing protein [Vibrio atlanticus]
MRKKYEIYNIYGNNASELEASFDSQRPEELTEKKFDALTNWDYDLSYNKRNCEIVTFTLDVTFKLPKIDTSTLSNDLKNEVHNYTSKLYEHEQKHCAIVAQCLHNIYKTIQEGQKGNCQNYIKKINDLRGKVQETNDLFDKNSEHGLVNYNLKNKDYLEMCRISIPDK